MPSLRARLLPFLLLLCLPPAAAQEEEATAATEVWVGHQVVEGRKPIPILGDLETRTDSYVLARVTREGDSLLLEQEACGMDIRETLGVAVGMSPEALRRLPPARIRLTAGAEGAVQAAPWEVSWGEADLDGDGQPGVSIRVQSSLCSGELYVASRSVSSLSGGRLRAEGGMEGRITVRLEQEILGASRACLQMGSAEQREEQRGQVVYMRAAAGTTCAGLALDRWPVRAGGAQR